MAWYVLRCKPRKDNLVEDHLNNQEFVIYRPTIFEAGKREAMFPGYLFIDVEDMYYEYHNIKYTPGLVDVLHFGNNMPTLSYAVISEIKRYEKSLEKGSITCHAFTGGSPVKITENPYRYVPCEFSKYVGKERAIVLLNILGGSRKIEVQVNQLKAI